MSTSAAGKANSELNFIIHNIFTKAAAVKKKARKQLVRLIVECASTSWDMLTQIQEKDLKTVQQ